jgi:hypothetical protein
MAIVTLQTRSGAAVGFTEDGGNRVLAGVDHPALFDLVQVERGIALRSVVPGWFLVADAGSGALCADGALVEPRATFRLEDCGDGLVVVRLASEPAAESDAAAGPDAKPEPEAAAAAPADDDAPDAIAIGSVLRLVEQDVTDMPHAGCCCGPGVHEGANWEEATHREIVRAAARLMGAARTDPVVDRFMTAYWPDEAFQRNLFEGLAMADTDARYARPTLAGRNLYGGHFYDPNSHESYMNDVSSVSPAKVTALTEGRRYFNLATWHARLWGEHRDEAGRLLGLALHFLTDLTQPMHASNFINLCATHYPIMSPAPEDVRRGYSPADWRHAWFETWVERGIETRLGELPALTGADLDTREFADCGAMLHEAAVASRKVFDEQLAAIADRKRGYEEDWSDAAPVLADTLLAAPRRVARFLKHWMALVMRPQPIDQKHWYRIKCSAPNAGGIGLHHTPPWGSHFIRSDDTGGNTQFLFLHNDDGTCSIACRDWIDNLWYFYDAPSGPTTKYDRTWLGEDAHGGRRDDRRTHFMVVENGSGDGVWIFEPLNNLAVTIYHRSPYPGWIVTDEPCLPEDQIFHLEQADEISADDHHRIRERWADWRGDA